VNQVIEDFYVAYAEGMLDERGERGDYRGVWEESKEATRSNNIINYATDKPLVCYTPPIPPSRATRGTRLPADFAVPEEWRTAAADKRTAHGLRPIDTSLAALEFINHFSAKPGAAGRMVDWQRAWMNWALSPYRREIREINGSAGAGSIRPLESLAVAGAQAAANIILRERARSAGGNGDASVGSLLDERGYTAISHADD